MAKGEPWSEEECMLALWAYSVVDRNRDVMDFVKADVYREVMRLTGRDMSAVRTKLNNVAACDPRGRRDKPVPVWDHVQGLLVELYGRYGHDVSMLDEFHQQYGYRHEMGLPGEGTPIGGKEAHIIEGEVVEGPSTRRKRSAILILEARKHYREISPDGLLHCAACGSTFDGVFDREIIHIHHLELISEIQVATRVGLREALGKVVPLCPTCHAIVHTRIPPMPVDEARRIVHK